MYIKITVLYTRQDKVVSSRKPSILVNKLSNLQIRDLEAPEEFDYEESLKSAIGNPVFGQEFVKMFIVADFGYRTYLFLLLFAFAPGL